MCVLLPSFYLDISGQREQATSVVTTKTDCYSTPQTVTRGRPQTARTAGGPPPMGSPTSYPTSRTGSMTSSPSTTAACGLTTGSATATWNGDQLATASTTSRLRTVSKGHRNSGNFDYRHPSVHQTLTDIPREVMLF